jgi:hypothetical protein
MKGFFAPLHLLFWVPVVDLPMGVLVPAAMLAVGCWVACYMREKNYDRAKRATAIVNTLVLFLFPFGTIFFVYWFFTVRKREIRETG